MEDTAFSLSLSLSLSLRWRLDLDRKELGSTSNHPDALDAQLLSVEWIYGPGGGSGKSARELPQM